MTEPVKAPGYYLFKFRTDHPQELIAFLSEMPFEAFEEGEVITAYLVENHPCEQIEHEVRTAYSAFFSSLKLEHMPPTNWNAVWESSFEPVTIEGFCHVRASFHPPFSPVEHEIVIDPKMAFGTGHHDTTYMMLEQMASIEMPGKSVLDMGCGTAVLAILTSKMGASAILGIDNDPAAVENSLENLALNEAEAEIVLGDATQIPTRSFDVILANINRGVLTAIMPDLKGALADGGVLLISGILDSDRELMVDAVQSYALQIQEISQRGEWLCMRVTHAA